MINAAIFSFVKTYDGSIVASVRLARFLRDLLELPLYEKGSESLPDNLDVLMIINGAYGFAGKDVLEMLGRAIETTHRVIWVQQDYTIIPPKDESGAESPFRKAFRNRHAAGAPPVDYWTTCEVYAHPGKTRTGHIAGPGSRYVNWNLLAFDHNVPKMPVEERPYPETMIYYGSYRKFREKAFQKYLRSPKVSTQISCPTDKFLVEGYAHDNIQHVEKFDDMTLLNRYGLGLYLEDDKSHVEFHSPANRFYEMLSAGLGMVFQPDAIRMMSKAEIEIDDFVYWNVDDGPAIMARAQEISTQQHELWYDRAYGQRIRLPSQVQEIWESYLENT